MIKLTPEEITILVTDEAKLDALIEAGEMRMPLDVTTFDVLPDSAWIVVGGHAVAEGFEVKFRAATHGDVARFVALCEREGIK